MRKYQAIWEHLKKNNECYLTAIAPGHHKRIKKAVIKEKLLDEPFWKQHGKSMILRTEFLPNGDIKFSLEKRASYAGLEDM